MKSMNYGGFDTFGVGGRSGVGSRSSSSSKSIDSEELNAYWSKREVKDETEPLFDLRRHVFKITVIFLIIVLAVNFVKQVQQRESLMELRAAARSNAVLKAASTGSNSKGSLT